MADPIWEDITDVIVDRIKAGSAAGYYTAPYEIRKCVRPNQRHNNYELEHMLCTVDLGGGFSDNDLEEQGNPLPRALTPQWEAFVYLMTPEDDKSPISKAVFFVIGGLVKSITQPTDTWHNWGGLAFRTKWTPFVRKQEDGAIIGCGLTLDVLTRVSELDITVNRVGG